MSMIIINNNEFLVVQKLLLKECGISLNDSKKSMVETRLNRRLKHYKVDSYKNYLKIVQISLTEKTTFLNLLTTNETYFFREQNHFDFLEKIALQNTKLRVWSAATSMGAEAYSIAAVLDYNLSKNNWEVYGSDINTEVLNIAQKALYPFHWSEKIPQPYRSKYCLQGHGQYEDKMLIDKNRLSNVYFFENNLMQINNEIGEFDIIFLRNVLLYFNEETKIKVILNVIENLKLGGFLIISLTETFESKKIENLKFIKNNTYQKV